MGYRSPTHVSGIVGKKPKRDWTAANEKRANENYRCRVCPFPSGQGVHLAHIIGRTHDFTPPLRAEGDWKPGQVHPDRIVPLCEGHHRAYDSHTFDLSPWLTVWEVLQAVADSATGRSNGFEAARIRLTGERTKVAA